MDEENLNDSDLASSLGVHDDLTTTNNSGEIGNDAMSNVNSLIENVDVDFNQNNDSTVVPNIGVSDEIGADMANSSNASETENDPLALSTELVEDLSINDSTINTTEVVTPENHHERDAAEQPNVRVIDDTAAEENDAQNAECDSMAGVVVKGEPVPIYDNHVCNDNEIDDVLDEPLEEVCDDIIMIIGRSGIPKPLRMTTEQTIKRENDPMSGNLTFSVSVSIHFMNKKSSLVVL